MFVLLVKIRLVSLWNVARHNLARHPALSLALSLLGVALFAGIYGAFRVVLEFVPRGPGTDELVYEVFYFLFLFLLAGAVPFVASTLLHANDFPLLSAAPVRPRSVVAAKLLDATVTNSLQFTVIGIPAIAACAAALGTPPLGWPVVALIVLLFVLLPALVTALMLLLALAALGTRRLRNAISAVNAVMATVVCLTIVVQASRLQITYHGRHMIEPMLAAASPSARFGPSGLFARSLIALSAGETQQAARLLGELGVVIVALYGACLWLGERLLSAASLAEEGEGASPGAVSLGEMRASRNGLLAPFTAPVAAIIAKDLKYILRDNVLLSQLGMPVILFFVPLILAMQRSIATFHSTVELYPFAAGMTGIIIFMQTSIVSLSSIGLESRSFWLMLSSPNGGPTLLWAKFVMSTLVSSGAGIVMTLLSALFFRAPLMVALVQCGVVSLMCGALCGMGVGISAALPRFVYENPAHRVSVWALILGFVATTAYLMLSAVIIVGAWYFATAMQEYAARFYAGGAVLFLLLTVASALLPMAIGIRRIEVYQWEH